MYPDDEQAQAAWDARCGDFPTCVCCGRSLYCWDRYHVVADEFLFCERCFCHEEHRIEDLEA